MFLYNSRNEGANPTYTSRWRRIRVGNNATRLPEDVNSKNSHGIPAASKAGVHLVRTQQQNTTNACVCVAQLTLSRSFRWNTTRTPYKGSACCFSRASCPNSVATHCIFYMITTPGKTELSQPVWANTCRISEASSRALHFSLVGTAGEGKRPCPKNEVPKPSCADLKNNHDYCCL